MAKKTATASIAVVRGERARRAAGVGAPVSARRAARRSSGRCASTRSIRRCRIAWAGSRRCSCRTKSSSRARSARCFESTATGAPTPLAPAPLDLDDPDLLLVERPGADAVERSLPPADGLCGLQPDLRRVPAGARPRHRVGDGGARQGPAAAGRAAVRLPRAATPATAARPATCRSATSTPETSRPASWCAKGLICTALSHDIIVARDDARAARRAAVAVPGARPTSTCRRSTRDSPISSRCSCISATRTSSSGRSGSRAAASRSGSLLTDLAREFGYARSKAGSGCGAAIGRRRRGHRGIRLRRAARRRTQRPLSYDDAGIEPHALGSVLVSAVFEAFTTVVKRKTERLFRIAGLDPSAVGHVADQRRAGQGHRPGGERRRQAVPQCLHPRHRLLPAGRHGARRVPAGHDHRRRRNGKKRQVGIPRSADALVPAPLHLSRSRPVHDRGRGAVAARRKKRCAFPARLQRAAI